MKLKILFSGLFFFTCFYLPVVKSQNISRYNSFSYNVNEGMMQSTISDMEVDKNNFCWISYPNGIQKFDGVTFTEIPIQPGLPDDKHVKFLKTRSGELFLSHSQGISIYLIDLNKFSLVYKNLHGIIQPAMFLGETDSVLYFYTEDKIIRGLHTTSFKIVSQHQAPWSVQPATRWTQPKFSSNIINGRVSFMMDFQVYLWDLKQGKTISKTNVGENLSPFFLAMHNENEVFYYTYKSSSTIQKFNFKTGHTNAYTFNEKKARALGRCLIFPWQQKWLISLSERIYETDSAMSILKAELVNYQNLPLSLHSSIHTIKEDNFGNLYLATVSDGIRKVMRNNYPLKYYHDPGLKSNFILSVLPDKKNNRVLAGSLDNGLLVFDTLQQLVKHFPDYKGKKFSPNAIVKKPGGDYLLFSSQMPEVITLSSNLTLTGAAPVISSQTGQGARPDYFSNPLYQDDTIALVQSQGNILRYRFRKNDVAFYEFTNAYTMSGVYHKGMIITHANNQLIFLDAGNFSEIKRVSFMHTSGVRCFAKKNTGSDENTIIYMGSNNGIFVINAHGKLLNHITRENGLPDECIYAMEFDDEGLLWCSTNKGICKVGENGNVLHLKKEDGLQENEFNTNVVARSPDGELYFGGVNGVSSFYPSAINTFTEEIQILITRLRINQSDLQTEKPLWKLEKISLPYNENSFAIDFLAVANNNPGHYVYQYKMEGIDKAWIQNEGLQTVRYLLPPGRYEFHLYASRLFDAQAVPMKKLSIEILPPWWNTWWFRSLAVIVLLLIIIYTINQLMQKKYRQKLAVLESEQKIQMERERISRDLHDNIGAYANAVLYKTELLEKENSENSKLGLMKDLRFASKDIIASLRETIWALKKEEYTAEECIIRIRNFIAPLARYYPHIHFHLNKPPAGNLTLGHTNALNLVRIIQEAIANSIKHGDVQNISVTNFEKNGHWFIEIKDDGKGFSALRDDEDTDESNGLINMKQRAAASGFDLQIQSVQGDGTTIWVKV